MSSEVITLTPAMTLTLFYDLYFLVAMEMIIISIVVIYRVNRHGLILQLIRMHHLYGLRLMFIISIATLKHIQILQDPHSSRYIALEYGYVSLGHKTE